MAQACETAQKQTHSAEISCSPINFVLSCWAGFFRLTNGQDCFFSDMTSSGVIVTLMPGADYSQMWLSDDFSLHLMGVAFLQQSLKGALTPPFGT